MCLRSLDIDLFAAGRTEAELSSALEREHSVKTSGFEKELTQQSDWLHLVSRLRHKTMVMAETKGFKVFLLHSLVFNL